jgi:hypothetical protein
MPLPLNDPNFFHERANEARQMADDIEDFGSKSVLVRIAIDFERLARRTSERMQKSTFDKKFG